MEGSQAGLRVQKEPAAGTSEKWPWIGIVPPSLWGWGRLLPAGTQRSSDPILPSRGILTSESASSKGVGQTCPPTNW